jgi:hypothetical protein
MGFFIEALCEGEVSEDVEAAVEALCKRIGIDTGDQGDAPSDFSRNVLISDDDRVAAMWFKINNVTRQQAEELVAELTDLGFRVGVENLDAEREMTADDLKRDVEWLQRIRAKAH